MDTACWPERTVTQWVWPSQKEGRSRTSTSGGATIGPTALSAYRIKGAGLDRPSRDTRYDAQSWREPPEVAGLGQPLHSLPRLQYSTCTPLCSTYTQDSAKHTEEPGRATRKTRSLLRESPLRSSAQGLSWGPPNRRHGSSRRSAKIRKVSAVARACTK